jgi:WD40 repeat protein
MPISFEDPPKHCCHAMAGEPSPAPLAGRAYKGKMSTSRKIRVIIRNLDGKGSIISLPSSVDIIFFHNRPMLPVDLLRVLEGKGGHRLFSVGSLLRRTNSDPHPFRTISLSTPSRGRIKILHEMILKLSEGYPASMKGWIWAKGRMKANTAYILFSALLLFLFLMLFTGRCMAYTQLYTLEGKVTLGDSVTAVAQSRDGKIVAVGSLDKSFYLFDDRGQLLWRKDTGGAVRSVAVSADGGKILVASEDHVLRFFDGKGGEIWSKNLSSLVARASLSEDGSQILVVCLDGMAYAFDPRGREVWHRDTGSDFPESVAMTPDLSRVALASQGAFSKIPRKYHVILLSAQGTLLWKKEMEKEVKSIALSPDGTGIAAGIDGSPPSLRLFNQDGTEIWSRNTGSVVRSITFSQDGDSIAACSYDTIYLFNRNGDILWLLPASLPDRVVMTPDASYIAAGFIMGSRHVLVFTHNGEVILDGRNTDAGIGYSNDIAMTPEGGYIAVGGGRSGMYFYQQRPVPPTEEPTSTGTAPPVTTKSPVMYASLLSLCLFVFLRRNHRQ